MAGHVIAPDDELVLAKLIRAGLVGTIWASALVSNRLVGTQQFAAIVRSDGGPALEPPTFLRRYGVRIFGPDGDDNHLRTGEFARYVAALIAAAPERAREVAAVRAVNGPMRVPSTASRPESYITCELVLVGVPITL